MEQQFRRDFFLFVGVLRYYKGLHILLDAIKNAPYKVVIVGSGPTESELKRQSEALDLDNVVFAGHLPDEDKVNLFNLCRGVVFPSYMRSEAFGVTLLEGSIFGKPLISAEIGSGTSHVNINGETGIVITPGSPKALREAMDRLYFNPDLARRLGQGARERYERLFTGELMGKRYNRLYLELLSQPRDALGKVVFPQRMTIEESGNMTGTKGDLNDRGTRQHQAGARRASQWYQRCHPSAQSTRCCTSPDVDASSRGQSWLTRHRNLSLHTRCRANALVSADSGAPSKPASESIRLLKKSSAWSPLKAFGRRASWYIDDAINLTAPSNRRSKAASSKQGSTLRSNLSISWSVSPPWRRTIFKAD